MTVLNGKYITAIFIFLTTVTTSLTAFASGAYSPMLWQIMPGEDIAETARLVYPKDPVARDSLLRAIIRINPEHFPQGVNRSLASGTIIQFPDLRTIGAYAKKTISKQQKQSTTKQTPRRQSQKISADTASHLKNNAVITQLIAQLEKAAASESRELIVLTNHIAALESLLGQLHLIPSAEKTATQNNSVAQTIPSQAVTEEIPSADPETVMDAEANASETDAAIEEAETEAETEVTETEVTETEVTETETTTVNSLVQPQTDLEKAENPSLSDNAPSPEPSIELSLTTDTMFLLGILLALLAALALLRGYRSIKRRFDKQSGSTTVSKSVRDQYETLLLRRKENHTEAVEPEPVSDTSEIMDEVNLLIEQNNSDAAIELLQKQLASNQRDIKGWLQLFELLYKTNNKRDFKKNARRFKRMKEFPEIWIQIQELGIRLEPNESLYFNEQKRKEKFFSESADSFH